MKEIIRIFWWNEELYVAQIWYWKEINPITAFVWVHNGSMFRVHRIGKEVTLLPCTSEFIAKEVTWGSPDDCKGISTELYNRQSAV